VSSPVQLPARRFGPLRSLWIRVGIAVACLAITTVLVYVERDGYTDSNGTPISWLDALYYATVTLSTTGYGDIVPASEQARLMNVLVITPLRFVFLITLVGTTVEVLTQRSRDEFRAKRWRQKVRDHVVVVGFGVKGRAAVTTLLEQGIPASDIVVVAHDRPSLLAATALGAVGVLGDATREEVLEEAQIARASRVIVSLDRDDTTVLVVLTARRLAPAATIVASAREGQNIPLLRQSGANTIIPTAESAGRMLALALVAPAAGRLVEDLLEPAHGLEIVERDITTAELGLAPESLAARHEMVVAVVRDGVAHRFDQGTVTLLQRGDRVVVIRPVPTRATDAG
jgi:voltage-gated potassium channel